MSEQSEHPAFDALKDKHKAFVKAYLQTFNAQKAYLAIGGKSVNPNASGYIMLHYENVRAAVKERMDDLGITPERIKSEYAAIAFDADLADFDGALTGVDKKTLKDLRDEGLNTKFIKSIKRTQGKNGESVTVELLDRLTALGYLAKIYAMVTEKHEHSGRVGVDHAIDDGIVMSTLNSIIERNTDGQLPEGHERPEEKPAGGLGEAGTDGGEN